MIANLRNYEPETIEFVVPDSIREKFPPVLFQGSTNVDELIKLVNEHFNATFPESEVTQRLLDEFEISEIREEYCIKQENEVPKRERELLEAIERAKKIKSDAQDRLASIKTEIKETWLPRSKRGRGSIIFQVRIRSGLLLMDISCIIHG